MRNTSPPFASLSDPLQRRRLGNIAHRQFESCFWVDFFKNFCTNLVKLIIHLIVCESDNFYSKIFQIAFSYRIRSQPGFLVMLPTVEFDCQPGFMTIKINDVSANYFLPLNCDRQFSKESPPQILLLLCHFSSKLLRIWSQSRVSW